MTSIATICKMGRLPALLDLCDPRLALLMILSVPRQSTLCISHKFKSTGFTFFTYNIKLGVAIRYNIGSLTIKLESICRQICGISSPRIFFVEIDRRRTACLQTLCRHNRVNNLASRTNVYLFIRFEYTELV